MTLDAVEERAPASAECIVYSPEMDAEIKKVVLQVATALKDHTDAILGNPVATVSPTSAGTPPSTPSMEANISAMRDVMATMRETLARIDEHTWWLQRCGVGITICFMGWCGWLTNKMPAGVSGLASIASVRVTEKTIQQTKNIVEESLEHPDSPRINPDLVRRVGNDMIATAGISTGKLSNDAWGAAIELINYRSVLNSGMSPLPPDGHPRTINGFLFNLHLIGDGASKIKLGDDLIRYFHTYGDDVPIDRAARVEPIGSAVNSMRLMGPRIAVMKLPSNLGIVRWLLVQKYGRDEHKGNISRRSG